MVDLGCWGLPLTCEVARLASGESEDFPSGRVTSSRGRSCCFPPLAPNAPSPRARVDPARPETSHDSRRLDGGRQAAGLLWLDVNTARSSASGQRPRTCSRWLARTGGARESRRRWTVVAGVSGGVVAAPRSAQVAVVTSRDRRGLKSFPGRRGREAEVQDV